MTDKVTHYDYYKAIPWTAFDKRAVKKGVKIYKPRVIMARVRYIVCVTRLLREKSLQTDLFGCQIKVSLRACRDFLFWHPCYPQYST